MIVAAAHLVFEWKTRSSSRGLIPIKTRYRLLLEFTEVHKNQGSPASLGSAGKAFNLRATVLENLPLPHNKPQQITLTNT